MPFSSSTLSWLTLAALAVAIAALLIALSAWQRTARGAASTAPVQRPPMTASSGPLAGDQVAAELDTLRAAVSSSLRHLAVVRYDAFGDMGGHLSWSMALLDDGGDGVVVTSIHGRSDSRSYAKNVASWSASQQLSPEEEEAINFARTSQS